MSHSPSSSGWPSASAQQYSPSLFFKASNQGCNGSFAHLPVGSRIRITAAASKRASLIPLRPFRSLEGTFLPAECQLKADAGQVEVHSALLLRTGLLS